MIRLTDIELEDIIARSVDSALANLPSKIQVTTITPRRLSESDAGSYCGRSGLYMRNVRLADKKRGADGRETEGPGVHYDGRTPFYFREDLDRWLDQKKAETPTQGRGHHPGTPVKSGDQVGLNSGDSCGDSK